VSPRPHLALAIALSVTTLLGGGTWLALQLSGQEPLRTSIGFDRLAPHDGGCRGNADCPSVQACVVDRGHLQQCHPNECDKDSECPTGDVCREVGSVLAEPGVRLCTPVGQSREGQDCNELSTEAAQRCAPGLLCNVMFCGRPCRLDEPASCPESFACREGSKGPSCVPSCKPGRCPEGLSCVQLPASYGLSLCTEVLGENCLEHPCPLGQKCAFTFTASWPHRIPMACTKTCGQDKRCPQGFLCRKDTCLQECSPSVAGTCGPNRRCQPLNDDKLGYVCRLWPY
jgi:hypothetical protein